MYNWKYIPGPEACENLEKYEPGGFHPVLIGGSFCDGRYNVIHKLGSGGFGTVWLARDTEEGLLVALKILSADTSQTSHELGVYQHLDAVSAWLPGHIPLAHLRNHFDIQGPNGTHVCLVLPFLGPSISSLRIYGETRKIRPDIARKVALEVVQTVSQVHESGVALGDLSTSNILFRVKPLHKMPTPELYSILGTPNPSLVQSCTLKKDSVPEMGAEYIVSEVQQLDHAPKYAYEPINYAAIGLDIIQPRITIVDLGESVILDRNPQGGSARGIGMNLSYGAPELHFGGGVSTASDVWALACCLFEIRSGEVLFNQSFGGFNRVVEGMTDAIGPVPDKLKAKLGSDHELLLSTKDRSLKARIECIGAWPKWCYWTPEERRQRLLEHDPDYEMWEGATPIERMIHRGPNPPNPLSEEERFDFTDLLTQMLRYESSERPTAKEVLEHPWFHRIYVDEWDWSGPWLQRYDQGMATWGYYDERAEG